jgi:hypothetical protein
VGEVPAELPCPTADGLIADIDASLGHQIFNIPETEGKPKVQPHRLADDVSWKSMASIGNRFHPLPSQIEPKTSKPQIANLSIAQVIDPP